MAFRRVLGFLVVPPAGADCTDCSWGWHEILHDWNIQVSLNLSGANNSAHSFFALTHMCRFTSPHFISLNSPHFTSFHLITLLHFISPHFTSPHLISLHLTSLHPTLTLLYLVSRRLITLTTLDLISVYLTFTPFPLHHFTSPRFISPALTSTHLHLIR